MGAIFLGAVIGIVAICPLCMGIAHGLNFLILKFRKWRVLKPSLLVQIAVYERAMQEYDRAVVEWEEEQARLLREQEERERELATERRQIAEEGQRRAREQRQRERRVEEERLRIQQAEDRQRRDYWSNLTGIQFEQELAALLRSLGYSAYTTRRTGDQGVDLIVRRQGKTTVVQCKRYSHPVGPSVVRELYGSMVAFGADQALLACTGGFTKGVRDFAREKPIMLWGLDDLVQWGIEAEKRRSR